MGVSSSCPVRLGESGLHFNKKTRNMTCFELRGPLTALWSVCYGKRDLSSYSISVTVGDPGKGGQQTVV